MPTRPHYFPLTAKLLRSSVFPICKMGLCSWHLSTGSRFADFVGGASHLTPNEVSVHEQEYGLGGSYLEGQLFEEEDEAEDTPVPPSPSAYLFLN